MKRWGRSNKQNSGFFKGLMVLGVFLLLVVPLKSQDQSNTDGLLDQEKWEELTEGVSYEPDDKPEEKEREQPVGNENEEVNFGDPFKYALIVLVLVIIGFFVYKFLPREWIGLTSESNKNRYKAYDADPEEDEEIRDLPVRLQKALNNGNYSMALRIYYLMIIKGLVKKGLIHWEKDKTNSQYLREMKDHDQFDHFRKATRAFEKVWYGAFRVDYQQFKEYEATFHEMAHHLNVQFNEE